ncbi:MAG: helix-hairpin-helix domain-containing protein [Chloroflexi bacterium]|nr:helix-hairpin-helix domain-containing protein [Chloroflexota bacterium]
MIRGVGKVMAERIVDRFGEETLDIIDYQPQELLKVLGIGKKRVDSITKSWEQQRAIKDVMIFLQAHGVSTTLATKIYKQYGDASLAVVQTTPYKLVTDVYGIGFQTADKIAQALGLAADDPGRIEAGVASRSIAWRKRATFTCRRKNWSQKRPRFWGWKRRKLRR